MGSTFCSVACKRVPPDCRLWALRKAPVQFIGFVTDAPDADAAIRLAITQHRGPGKLARTPDGDPRPLTPIPGYFPERCASPALPREKRQDRPFGRPA